MDKVSIKESYCKGCSFCIVACKRDVLEIGNESNVLGYKFVTVKKGERCISCTLCAVMCPEAAIEICK